MSLLPEATEILIALGLGDHIVPAPCADTPLSLTWEQRDCATTETLASARPTHVFAAATSDGGAVCRRMVRRLVAPLRPRPAVYALEPHTLGDVLSDIKTVGDATGQQAAARALILELRIQIDRVTLGSARALATGRTPRIACLGGITVSGEPVASGWWLAELVGLAGGHDVFGGAGQPPRPLRWSDVAAARPEQVWAVGFPATPPPAALAVWPAGGLPCWRACHGGTPGSGIVAVLDQFAAWAGPYSANDTATQAGGPVG